MKLKGVASSVGAPKNPLIFNFLSFANSVIPPDGFMQSRATDIDTALSVPISDPNYANSERQPRTIEPQTRY